MVAADSENTDKTDYEQFRNAQATRPPCGRGSDRGGQELGRLVDRVREERATIVIERGGKAVAQITPLVGASFTFAALKSLVVALPAPTART